MKIVAVGREELANGLRTAGVEAHIADNEREAENIFSSLDADNIGLVITHSEFEHVFRGLLVVGIDG